MVKDLNTWLLDPSANPVVLVNAFHESGVRHLATQPYITCYQCSPPNVAYDDFLIGGLTLAAQLGANRTIGELNFYALEDEANCEWGRYEILMGDMRWEIGDFFALSKGHIEQATRPARNQMRLSLSDPAQQLQSQALKHLTNDTLTPLALGSVSNATPVLEAAITRKYRANQIPCTITAVRDNGLPVAAYTDHGDGSFSLLQSVAGEITCDIEESHNTVFTACEQLAQLKEIPLSRAIHFSEFQQQATIGLYVTGNETVWDLMTQLSNSIGAFPRFNELGELELIYLPHQGEADLQLSDDDVVLDGFSQSRVIPPANIQFNYAANWTTQSSLAGAVTEADRERYNQPQSVIHIDNQQPHHSVQALESLLVAKAHAQTEANRRGALWKKQREVWQFEVLLAGLAVNLGQRVHVRIHDVIDQTGTVIAWSKRPDRKKTEIEVMF